MFHLAVKILVTFWAIVVLQHRVHCYSNWIDPLLEQIINEVNPYQVTLLIREEPLDNAVQWNSILGSIVSTIPTVLIDLSEPSNSKRSLDMPIHKNARSARVLFVLLHNQINSEADLQILCSTLDTIAHLALVQPRPKCLIILLGRISDESLNAVFQYSWSLKFLDLVILEVATNNKLTRRVCFDPFTNRTREMKATDNLFPDKLKNTANYPLSVGIFSHPPDLIVTENLEGDVVDVKGFFYQFIKLFTQVINATINYIYKHGEPYNESMIIFQKLHKISVIPIPVGSTLTNHTGWKILASQSFGKDQLVIIAPNVAFPRINLSMEVLITIVSLPIILAGFTLIARVIQYPQQRWNTLQILGAFMGISLQRQFYAFTERVLFITLVFLSIIYTSRFTANLMNVNLIREEESFNTLEQVAQTGFPIYVFKTFFNVITSHSDAVIKNFMTRAVIIENIEECWKVNLQYKPSFCVVTYSNLDFIFKTYKTTDGVPIMKPTGITLLEDNLILPFGWGSPFVEKFNVVMQRLFESGIPVLFFQYNNTEFQMIEKDRFGDNLVPQLLIVLIAGYLLALASFAIEFLKHARQRRMRA